MAAAGLMLAVAGAGGAGIPDWGMAALSKAVKNPPEVKAH